MSDQLNPRNPFQKDEVRDILQSGKPSLERVMPISPVGLNSITTVCTPEFLAVTFCHDPKAYLNERVYGTLCLCSYMIV